jgi:hypothetical protein
MSIGISISNVMDFRVDHCCLEHICADGIATGGLKCRGVIDHCSIYNIYGWDNLGGYTDSNVGYGIVVQRDYDSPFDPTMSVLGQYTDYTIFIEDCYFSRWRHCVASGVGGYYVFRHNIVDYDLGHFSMDVHGVRTSGYAGGRGAEIYENTFINVNQWIPVTTSPFYNVSRNSANTSSSDYRDLFQDGGGCGVWFNNYIDTSYRSDAIALYTEDDISDPTWHLKDFCLWSTQGPWTPNSWNGPISGFSGRNVAAYWSRSAGSYGDASYPNVDPSWSIAGYTPYPYPHPLTLGT